MVELQLDSVKPSQKESVRRTLFLDSQQPSLLMNFSLSDGGRSCHDTQIYLRVSNTCVSFAKQSNSRRGQLSIKAEINVLQMLAAARE